MGFVMPETVGTSVSTVYNIRPAMASSSASGY
jgi:hypothetical protein